MDKKIVDELFALLNYEMGFKELPKDFSANITQEDLKQLYLLAKKHDLAHIVAGALEKLGVLNAQNSADKKLITEKNMAIFRTETHIAELEALCSELCKGGIDHVPLKGSVIRNLYPETWMRTSCDIDVLVKEEDLNRAISLLTDNLGYECRSIGQHDAQIYTPLGVHVELHYSLQEAGTDKKAGEYLDSVWQRVTPADSHTKVMPNDFLYTYLISHIIKHVKFGGCGIRSVMDLFILARDNGLEDTRQPLKDCDFLTFANGVENLANAWFGDGEMDELSARLEEYIIIGGVYGTFETKVSAMQSRHKNRFRYLLSRLFMPYRELKFKYPVLKKCPLLYPFCIIARWSKLVFDKQTKQRVSDEVKRTGEVVKDDNGIKKLMQDLGV